jgi:hypothetical protein
MKIPSTCLLWFLSIFRRHLHQYVCRDPSILTESKAERLNHCFIIPQTSFVKGQSLHRRTGVSWSLEHSWHSMSSVQPLLKRLFVVGIFLCNKVHAKKSAFLFRFSLPYWCQFQLTENSSKMNLISTLCSVFSIHRPSPGYTVFDCFIPSYFPYCLPKLDKLCYFLTRCGWINMIDPFFILQCWPL